MRDGFGVTGRENGFGPPSEPTGQDRIDTTVQTALGPLLRQGPSVVELSLARTLAEQLNRLSLRPSSGDRGAGL